VLSTVLVVVSKDRETDRPQRAHWLEGGGGDDATGVERCRRYETASNVGPVESLLTTTDD